MLIRNGLLFGEDFTFRKGNLLIEGDRISAVLPEPTENLLSGQPRADADIIDAQDCYVIPGLIDIHIHGCAGREFCDGQPGNLAAIGRYLASQGITSYMPASLSLPEDRLIQTCEQARVYQASPAADAAMVAGIYLEGPFFAKEKRGAHAEAYIIPADSRLLERLDDASGHLIRVVCLAPESEGGMDLIAAWKARMILSVAHTAADYDTAVAAFQAGATQVTHLFNAMKPFGHREPGVPGAAFDCAANVELIADGIHLHPAMVRAAFRLYGSDRVILISDAMAACGMPDGHYHLGDLTVQVSGGSARLPDGTIAGSAINLMEAVRRAVRFGIPLPDALRAATANPARITGLQSRIGSLAAGKQADLVILDRQLNLVAVLLRGQWLDKE